MKILLIAPTNERGEKFTFPLGLAYISSVLKEAGHLVTCKNMEFEQEPMACLQSLLEDCSPDIVGIGGLSHSFTQIQSYFELISQKMPDVVRILGGGIASGDPSFMIEQLPIDIVVIGEGEDTIVEITQALEENHDLSKITGIIYRKRNGEIIKTERRHIIDDLDRIPWPDYEGFNFEKHLEIRGPYIEMIASRGCPYRCTFCSSNLGRKYRTRNLTDFHKELQFYQEKYGIKTVAIYDELFTSNKKRMYDFCELMKNNEIEWWTQLRIDSLDENVLKVMKKSGCSFISLGLESMNDIVLKSMGKKITTTQLQKGLKVTRENHVGFFGNFIFGDPAETEETAWDTLKWWRDNLHYSINIGFITCYPGSHIYEYAVENKLIANKLNFYEENVPLVNISKMTDGQFTTLKHYVYFYLDALVNPGKLLKFTLIDKTKQSFDATVLCPQCFKENVFTDISKSSITFERVNIFRPLCNHCKSRFDLPVLIPMIDKSSKLTQQIVTIKNIISKKGFDTALSQIHELIKNYPSSAALYYYGSICYFSLMDTSDGFGYLQEAMRRNPLYAPYFEFYSQMRELHEDPYDETIFFAKHAQKLRKANPKYEID